MNDTFTSESVDIPTATSTVGGGLGGCPGELMGIGSVPTLIVAVSTFRGSAIIVVGVRAVDATRVLTGEVPRSTRILGGEEGRFCVSEVSKVCLSSREILVSSPRLLFS